VSRSAESLGKSLPCTAARGKTRGTDHRLGGPIRTPAGNHGSGGPRRRPPGPLPAL